MKMVKIGNRYINFDLIDLIIDEPVSNRLTVTFLQTVDAEIVLYDEQRSALLKWLDANSTDLNNLYAPPKTVDEFRQQIISGTYTPPTKITYPQTIDGFKELVKSGDYVILDTETTGLDNAEIVQITIIDSNGQTLLNTLVKPMFKIPAQATAVHGITEVMCANAPGWNTVSQQVKELLTGKNVIIYNAVYDRKMMHQSSEKANIEKIEWKELAKFYCAMEFYAEFHGEWNDYRGSYRWQKLTDAIRQQKIQGDFTAHDALGDCLMTLALVKKMAGV